ncbi:IS66 family insertion sequence element accessory protein TnpB [Rhizobium mesoamericanum]|uniref:IS66 family insertion sequence element accessory protein TnpB n=1 Tax=Rhizobium mesoamericanum TaxID=1079800 RepID=UPI000A30965C
MDEAIAIDGRNPVDVLGNIHADTDAHSPLQALNKVRRPAHAVVALYSDQSQSLISGRGGVAGCYGWLRRQIPRQRGGAVFAFRGRRGDRLKLLYFDGQGFCLYLRSRRMYCARKPGPLCLCACL